MLKNKRLYLLFSVFTVALLTGYTLFYLRTPAGFLQLTVGDSYLFAVDYHSVAEFEQNALSMDPATMNAEGQVLYDFKGTLRLTPVAYKDDHYTIESTLSGTLLTGQTAKEFQEYFTFRWAITGVVNDFTFEASRVEENSFLITDIMENFDVLLSTDNTWTRKVTRRYGSEIETYSSDKRQKQFTLKVNENNSLYRIEKNSVLQLDQGIVENIQAFRERTFYGQGKKVLSKDTLEFTAKITDTSKNYYQQQQSSKFRITEPFADDINLSRLSDMARQNHVKNKLEQKKPAELFASIAENALERKYLIADGYILAAYLEFDPDAVKDEVLIGLDRYDWDDLRFDTLVKNLVYVGNKQSQEFLMAAISYEDDFRKQAQLIIALGFVEAPSHQSLKFMLDLAQSGNQAVRNQAELMLGSMLEAYDNADDLASDTFLYLVNGLEKATETTQVRHYLAALGNTALPEAYSVISRYLDADELEVKATAINALRLIESPDATGKLIAYLSNEDADIRELAADALTYRSGDLTVLRAIEERLQEEVNRSVLKLLLYNIIQEKNNFPEVRPMLESFLSNCGVTDLCEYVKGSL